MREFLVERELTSMELAFELSFLAVFGVDAA